MVVGGTRSPTLTLEEIERRRGVLCDFWRWACGAPEARAVGETHPRYVEVTEGRDTGAAYSSCRDLAHAGLTRIGVRLSWLLREELGTWAYGEPIANPSMVPWSGIVEAGDVLVVAQDWPRGHDAHVICVLGVEGERLLTAEYGQPGGALKSYPIGDVLAGRRVRVRLPFAETVWDAFHRGLLVEPDWPRRSDTEPSPPPEPEDEPTLPGGWIRGLDVSDLQNPARLDCVAAFSRGFKWLVAKLSDGKDPDLRGAEHLRNAAHAGMVIGGYHFCIPWRDPRTQLDALVKAAAAAGYGTPGHLLPWLDIESWRGSSGTWRQAEPSWNDVAEPLAELIAAEFGGVCIYMNHADWVALGKPTWIDRYPLVAAHYGVPAGSPRTAGGLQWAIHQHLVAPVPGIYPGPIDQCVARTPLPLIGRDVPEPTKLDPAEIERLQIPLTISLEDHWAFRDQVIRQQTEEGRFD